MRRLSSVVLVVAALVVGGCDRFFELEGIVAECGAGTPIAGAKGQGVWVGHGNQGTFVSDDAGAYFLHINAPYDVDAQVTVTATGYMDLTTLFHGQPADPHHVTLCLDRAP